MTLLWTHSNRSKPFLCRQQELLNLQQHVLLAAVHQTFSFQTTSTPVVLWQAAHKEGAPCPMLRAGHGDAPPGSSAVSLGQRPLVVAVSWPCGICFLLSCCCARLLQMACGSMENRSNLLPPLAAERGKGLLPGDTHVCGAAWWLHALPVVGQMQGCTLLVSGRHIP